MFRLQAKAIFLLSICFSLISCKQAKSPMNTTLIELLGGDSAMKNNQIKACLVIPRAGCTGCIAEALLYAKEKVDYMKYSKVILTDISDRKLIALQAGSDFMKHRNVILDSANSLLSSFSSAYPKVYYFDDLMNIEKEVDFNPLSTDLMRLK